MPRRCFKLALFVLIVAVIGLSWLGRTNVQAQADDARQAVALLHARCLQCHGEERAGGLDLRTRESALKGGTRGAAFSVGQADTSLLIQFVTAKQQPRMPLGGELSAAEIALLKRWIDAGANWASVGAPPTNARADLLAVGNYKGRPLTAAERSYWAFRPVQRPALPAASARGAAGQALKNPIDQFIRAEQDARGLQPVAAADKRTLLRRVTFDLIGLPPTPAETDDFLRDPSPNAYAKVVRRLLASPHYGERWGQHWLDVVRFAETHGFELDGDREQAWRYRDYVIRSLNADKPYDRFLVEQIAGDELASSGEDSFEMHVATGFLRAGPQHVVAGNQDEAVNRQEWLTEAMLSVGNAALGLTVGCARCHDHKFDPISQADYYRMQAFFGAADNSEFARPSAADKQAHAAAIAAYKAKLKPINEQIALIEKPYRQQIENEKRAQLEPLYAAALAKPAAARTPAEKALANDAERMLEVKWDEVVPRLSPTDRTTRAGLRQQLHRLELFEPERLPAALSVTDVLHPVPPMRLLIGGDPHRPTEALTPRVPSVFLPPDAPALQWIQPVAKSQPDGSIKYSTGRRLALARWLTQPDNPLVARVMMNRLWHYHFGRGIVATPNDFGRNGQPPTHPALLDWLAAEFIARGWSLKQMHELMVLSATYQQSSLAEAAVAPAILAKNQQVDPENKFLWRMNRQRLDAEALRDAVLAVSGTLNLEMLGKSVRVPLEPEVYDTIFTEGEPDNLWPVHPDVRQHTRRSLYLLRKRNVRLPLLVAYDAPDLMSSCGARGVSVHALQALTMMNSAFLAEQSKALAQRVLAAGTTEGQRLSHLFQLALARPPRAEELRLSRAFLASQQALIATRQQQGQPLHRLAQRPADVSETAAAAWVDLCLATLNLSEFLYLN